MQGFGVQGYYRIESLRMFGRPLFSHCNISEKLSGQSLKCPESYDAGSVVCGLC